MGSTVFVFAETSNAVHGQRGTPMTGTRCWHWRLAAFGRRMTDVADYVQARGMRFAYHHHLGTVVETPRDLEQFLRHTAPPSGSRSTPATRRSAASIPCR
jgi:inosose dehydratase